MLKGNIDKRLKKFLNDHRNDYDEKWKEELRDGWKWYFLVIHPEENTEHLTLIEPIPPKRDEAQQIVWDGYLKFLEREADDGGYKFYSDLIRQGRLTKETFEQALKNSDEYRNKVIF